MRQILKYQCGRLLISGIICCVIGLGFTLFGVRDWIGLSGNLSDFNQMENSEIREGKYVKGEITACLGAYFEEEIKTTFGRSRNKKRIYIIPVGEKKTVLIGVLVGEHRFRDFDNLTMRTLQNMKADNGSIGTYQGRICKCNGRMSEFLGDYKAQFKNSSKLKDCFVPYYIDSSDASGGVISTVVGGGAVIVGLIIIFFVFLPKYKAEKYARSLRNDINIGTVIYEAPDVMNENKEEKMSVFADEDWDNFMREGEEKR